MARDWEAWLTQAAKPASPTEEQDRDRTERRIREAIAADSRLASNVRVFAKGSYKNGTNVRRDSDVDIAVMWNRWAYLGRVDDAADMTWDALGASVHSGPQSPSPTELRQWVAEALLRSFGSGSVDATGNKAITVEGGTTRLDADVVPCFEFKRFSSPGNSVSGIVLYPRDGSGRIVNFPEQNYTNGVSKNAATQRSYKQIVRALKRLENDMVESRRLPAPVHGYFIECLLYNLPDPAFRGATIKLAASRVLATLWEELEAGRHDKWVELNACKWLWYGGQTWTPEEASRFAYRAWNYIEGNL